MAESKRNIVIQGMSGKLGDMIVFRQRAGKTIAAAAPRSPQGEGTPAQQAVREKFQQAILYGRTAISDPATKEEYQAKAPEGKSAFNVAVADFFNAPDIVEIDVKEYSGSPGQRIRVKVTDDFKVKSVWLAIQNDDGSIVEQGNAIADPNGIDWIYTSTTENLSLPNDKVTVTATDNPDNLAVSEKTL